LYLTEIVKRLFAGLEHAVPDEKERVKWILENQVFGCAPSNIIYNMVKNYVYAGYPELSGQNLLELDLTEAAKAGSLNEALQEGLGKEMKFDVVIGNPPYQQSDGGDETNIERSRGGATPLYNLFVEQAKKLNPRYISLIIPARWYSGGRGLDNFRSEMLNDSRISHLTDYPTASDLFSSNVEIKGGVCYFLWNREHKGPCVVRNISAGKESVMTRPLLEKDSDVFIRNNEAISILRKVNLGNDTFSTLVSSQKPFGLRTYIKGHANRQANDIILFENGGVSFVNKADVTTNIDWIPKHKVLVTMAYGAGDEFPHQIINTPIYAEPNSCCTETYVVVGPFESKEVAINVISYMKSRFFRFLVMLRKHTQHAARGVYSLVPIQDFSKSWSDEELYEKYKLTDEEITFIESMIRPME